MHYCLSFAYTEENSQQAEARFANATGQTTAPTGLYKYLQVLAKGQTFGASVNEELSRICNIARKTSKSNSAADTVLIATYLGLQIRSQMDINSTKR